MNKTLGIVLALTAGCCASAPSADAQQFYTPERFGLSDQTYSDVPGVPDAQGCVKSCFEDYSPCDPPVYKHADGRCETRRFGRR